MRILHPHHTESLSLEDLKKYKKDGIYDIIEEKEREKLNYFLKCFEEYRIKNNLIIKDDSIYKNLPFSIDTDEWKERQKDLKVIKEKIRGKENLKILDVGSWNGWLSNYLSKEGHHVTALNLFMDEFDGLLSKNKYDTNYISIQINVEELYRVQDHFDIIIFNRNWAFFKNQQKVFNDAKKMLNSDGKIIFTGIPFYKNPEQIIDNLRNMNKKFKSDYNIPMIYNHSKGFLDATDFSFFSKNNISLNSYNKIKNLIKFIFPKKAKVYYGTYKNN